MDAYPDTLVTTFQRQELGIVGDDLTPSITMPRRISSVLRSSLSPITSTTYSFTTLVFWVSQEVGEVSVVGQQEKTVGVLVESPNGKNPFLHAL